nr:uncharacterized protein LOC109161479 [Ipomoea batatas]
MFFFKLHVASLHASKNQNPKDLALNLISSSLLSRTGSSTSTQKTLLKMPSSSYSSRVRANMEYESSIFCNCGLKAPICTTIDSGQKFSGCQRWKVGIGQIGIFCKLEFVYGNFKELADCRMETIASFFNGTIKVLAGENVNTKT